MIGRRCVIKGGLAVAASIVLPQFGGTALAQTTYLKTREILQRSRDGEVDAYRQYAAFTKQAKADGYPGIAYLFTALATAELIHGQNFEKILARLGVEITPLAEHQIQVGSTQQNLIKAAADEIDSVDTFYPGMLKALRPEGFQDAITMTTYAWETEKQHLDILKSIQRWTPNHFEAVAKKIENETGQYFVCQICGATMIEIPQGKCPICKFSSENLRKIEPPV
ncbi:MAG TPA: ferritin family protein [Micropepsaceae bacterium]|nr:ferritin family protein [Micropepsaceae bacterium]